jgi:hypothetical protein
MDLAKLKAKKTEVAARLDKAAQQVLSARSGVETAEGEAHDLDTAMGRSDPGDAAAWSGFETKHRAASDKVLIARRRLDSAQRAEKLMREQIEEELSRLRGQEISARHAALRELELKLRKNTSRAADMLSADIREVRAAAQALQDVSNEFDLALGQPGASGLVDSKWAYVPGCDGEKGAVITLRGIAQALEAEQWADGFRSAS